MQSRSSVDLSVGGLIPNRLCTNSFQIPQNPLLLKEYFNILRNLSVHLFLPRVR